MVESGRQADVLATRHVGTREPSLFGTSGRALPSRTLEPTACPICASRATRSLRRGTARYVRCERCAALSRTLTAEEYAKLDPTYDAGPVLRFASAEERRRFLDTEGRIRFLRTYAAPRPGQRLLDIGSGPGTHLLAARELRLEAVGVEPSSAQVAVCRSLGLDVREGYFVPEAFEPESFDIVVMSHVIEHVLDPGAFLRGALSRVRPGGVLLVVTPNAAAPQARLSGRHWPLLKPADHVRMLARESFEALGVHELGRVTFAYSEHPWEPAATLASAARDMLLGRTDAASSHVSSSVSTSSGRVKWSARFAVARPLLSLASAPLRRWGRGSTGQAALIVRIERPPGAATSG
jgi:SAM-dependent methyltransferase